MRKFYHVEKTVGKETKVRIAYIIEENSWWGLKQTHEAIVKDWIEEPHGVELGYSVAEKVFFFWFEVWVDETRREQIGKEYLSSLGWG